MKIRRGISDTRLLLHSKVCTSYSVKPQKISKSIWEYDKDEGAGGKPGGLGLIPFVELQRCSCCYFTDELPGSTLLSTPEQFRSYG